MLVDKIRELANDLRRIHLDFKSMELDMRVEAPEEREVDIDKVIDDLNIFKLNITYLRLKASE